MSFAIVGSGVAVTLERFGKGHFFIRQSRQFFPVMQRLIIPFRPSSQPLRQVGPPRVFARQDAGPTRRADMASRVGIGEEHPVLRQLIDGRSFMKLAAIAADIPLPQVIDQKENDVGFGLGMDGRCQERAEENADHRDPHQGI